MVSKYTKYDGSDKDIKNHEDTHDLIWYRNPEVLLNAKMAKEFFPMNSMSYNRKLNAILRLSIYVSLILAIIKRNYNYIYIVLVAMLLTYYFHIERQNDSSLRGGHGKIWGVDDIEKFENNYNGNAFNEDNKNICNVPEPTTNNPMMNINLITRNRNQNSAPMSYNKPELKKDIDNKFNTDLFRDVSSVYGKRNSQRQFYTMPSTTIPNEQTAFAKWLYNTGPTCKEDGIKCAPTSF